MTNNSKLTLYLLILAENQSVASTKNTNKFFKHFAILRPEQGLSTVFSVTSIFFSHHCVLSMGIVVHMEHM